LPAQPLDLELMVDHPLVSVIMPVYNGRRYVYEAVDSILAQTFSDFEFIIIDDGSTDGTSNILKHYAAKDQRIRLVSRPNQGVSRSLVEGLALAQAPLVARMDADDISLPTRFEKQVKFLQDNPDHVLIGCRCLLIDPDGYPICEKRDIALTHEQIDGLLMKMSWPLVHPAVMMRAEALKKIGGYDPRYRTNQDHDLFLRLAEVGKLANYPEVLLEYRQHFKSVGFTKVASQASTVMEIAKAAHARRGIPFPEPVPGKPQILRPHDHHRNWSWWALRAGNIATARRHAVAMLWSAPFDRASWRAIFCALRGH
jgi:glycosyltransferase involved in cell wall biosynthesis